MPSSAKMEWPQGQPLFEVQWRAISESLAGNGVQGTTDLEVSATSNALEIEVSTGSVYYLASEVTLGTAETHTLSSGDGTYDRWDTVYFDTSTGSSGVREGTPEQYPQAPDIQGDEILLAVIYVAQGATDVADADILNWRALPGGGSADRVSLVASDSLYSGSTVDDALGEVIRQSGGDPLNSALDVSSIIENDGSLLTGTVDTGQNQDFTMTSASIANDEQIWFYPIQINGGQPPLQMAVGGDGSSYLYWYGDRATLYDAQFYNETVFNDPIEIYDEATFTGGISLSSVIDPGTLNGAMTPQNDPGSNAFGIANFYLDSSDTRNSYSLRVDDQSVIEVGGIGDGSGGFSEIFAVLGPGAVKVPMSGAVQLQRNVEDFSGTTFIDYDASVVRNLESHAADHESGGSDEITHNNLALNEDDHHAPPTVVTDTQSGDGSATTFTISHNLGAVPSGATIQPTSEAAAARHWRSNLTDSAIEVTYSTAPPDATDNLSWEVTIQP